MITVYGIPTCATVKKCRKALDDKGVAYAFVDFRKSPPPPEQVQKWVAKLGTKAMRNLAGGSYRALGDEKDAWSDSQWTAAYTKDPMLIKRPIVERDGEPVLVGFKDADVAAAGL
jgi:arsenate reductase